MDEGVALWFWLVIFDSSFIFLNSLLEFNKIFPLLVGAM